MLDIKFSDTETCTPVEIPGYSYTAVNPEDIPERWRKIFCPSFFGCGPEVDGKAYYYAMDVANFNVSFKDGQWHSAKEEIAKAVADDPFIKAIFTTAFKRPNVLAEILKVINEQ